MKNSFSPEKGEREKKDVPILTLGGWSLTIELGGMDGDGE